MTWFQDEKVFLLWGGNLIGEYPLTAQDLNDKYIGSNGGCEEADNFYPMTAFDEDGVVGSFIMRYIKGDNKKLRFGWVVVDSSKRGRHYGNQMIQLGLQYAFSILQVEKVTIGVFDNNPSAHHCYLSCGFRNGEELEGRDEVILGEPCRVIELEITKEEWKARQQDK